MLFQTMLFFTRLKNKVRYFKYHKKLRDIDFNTSEGTEKAANLLFSGLSKDDQKHALLLMHFRRSIEIVPILQNRPIAEYKTPNLFERYLMSEVISKKDWDHINQTIDQLKEDHDFAAHTLSLYQQFDGFTEGQCRYFNPLLSAGFNTEG